MKKNVLVVGLLLWCSLAVQASYIFIPMNPQQKDHLKAYGIAYRALATYGLKIDWLLNYQDGSFGIPYTAAIEKECLLRNVSYEVMPDAKYSAILSEIAQPEANMDAVKLDKPPKIAVYTPSNKPSHPNLPWDDAVTLVLEYAEIPFDKVYDEEVLNSGLVKYDWLHLHHEDFTGQYGRFYASYRNQPWYVAQVQYEEQKAKQLGFGKVSQMKLAVAQKIKEYVAGGGFMFAMCSATDSYDIALAAEGIDICASMFDGDGMTADPSSKLNYLQGFAFKDYKLSLNPNEYEFADIDIPTPRIVPKDADYFTLFDFSAKWDPVPSMLTQDHTHIVKGFMGQTTAFRKKYIRDDVLIMGENKSADEARYIHGEFGEGFWTFYGGHDPEDYQHMVGDPETKLELHPNSPGYRLILNNVLFPAARKKPRKT
ncbi:MAG: hypothetical protein JNM36_00935 [Chitinophagales bacterium]|jgi:hypothetical protein|nr:hypothetical protein [Chitinophagales bacterium]